MRRVAVEGGKRGGVRRPALWLGAPAALLALVVGQAWMTAREEYLPRPPYEVAHTVTPDGEVRAGADTGQVRLAVLGDSTVEGIGSPTAEGALPVLVASRVAEALDRTVGVVGLGVSGARTRDVQHDQAPRLAGGEWDVVLVVVGSNDVTHAHAPWRMAETTRRMLEEVEAASRAPVVLGGIPEFHTVPAVPRPLRWLLGWQADLLRARQAAAARDVGVRFVDIRAEASPRFLGRPESMSADGFHPSDLGYGLWADALAPQVADAVAAGDTAPE
ncbi:SGNH/GDSL hydrolase family protein [Egibacter rhizosphaerae]|uniref:SGNH/GDSL hydrolase family protein n=1 Tax=Egibacter rhizosphaerae TaxID=1670831 RepID=A0A411YG82_9ACTN|nr:SGNH/GDSL hydrolase family protein [Egibacter rhizosphaerae]QBI20161.1 SGNH/GDSL hydrolase family protein [Egibacter rhizosphaerae]